MQISLTSLRCVSSFAPVYGNNNVSLHSGGSPEGGADSGGAISMHGLDPRGSEDNGAFVLPASGQDPMGPQVGLGKSGVPSELVGFDAPCKVDPGSQTIPSRLSRERPAA